MYQFKSLQIRHSLGLRDYALSQMNNPTLKNYNKYNDDCINGIVHIIIKQFNFAITIMSIVSL